MAPHLQGLGCLFVFLSHSPSGLLLVFHDDDDDHHHQISMESGPPCLKNVRKKTMENVFEEVNG